MISLLLALCLILVIASMLIALNATSRLDLLRRHNDSMQSELSQLRSDYQELQALLAPSGQAEAETTPEAEPDPEKPPEIRAREQLMQYVQDLGAGLAKYAERNAGLFPANLDNLSRFAESRGLNNSAQNPFSGLHGRLFSADTILDITHEPADEGLSEYAGKILYQAQLNPEGQASDYTLAAFDGAGFLLKTADGEILARSKADFAPSPDPVES